MLYSSFKNFICQKKAASIMDAQELVSRMDKSFGYSLYVNNQGQLIYTDKVFNNEITGVCEWTNEIKLNLQIDPSTTVLDITSSA